MKFDSEDAVSVLQLSNEATQLHAEDPRTTRSENQMHTRMRKDFPRLRRLANELPFLKPEMFNPSGQLGWRQEARMTVGPRRGRVSQDSAALPEGRGVAWTGLALSTGVEVSDFSNHSHDSCRVIVGPGS
ncbi:hypothetical protein GCM10009105_08080 [Dokdonella soli]|uniref:Uncharacterized protein n=1 Tax=Dokdonella soli TaxID=529810 RepID=A0ABN1IDY1_9GAMM